MTSTRQKILASPRTGISFTEMVELENDPALVKALSPERRAEFDDLQAEMRETMVKFRASIDPFVAAKTKAQFEVGQLRVRGAMAGLNDQLAQKFGRVNEQLREMASWAAPNVDPLTPLTLTSSPDAQARDLLVEVVELLTTMNEVQMTMFAEEAEHERSNRRLLIWTLAVTVVVGAASIAIGLVGL